MSASADNNLLIKAMPVVFVLIWSTGFIVAKYGLPYSPALTFLTIRFALSLICFALWVTLAGVAWPKDKRQWWHLAVVGVLVHAGYLGGVWSAVKAGMGSGLVALMVCLQPVLTALWLSAFSRDNSAVLLGGARLRVTPRQWLGLALGLMGLLLVVSRKLAHSGQFGGEVTWFTMLASTLALLSITAGTLYQKRFVTVQEVRSANAIQIAAALLVTAPLALFEAETISWTPQFVGALAWSVLALSLGGSSLLYLLIQRGAATAVTSLLYLVPPCTALMAWLLFAEPITVVTLVGTAITAVGVSLVIGAARPASSA